MIICTTLIIFGLFSMSLMIEQLGDFEAKVAKHETCRGPKRKNCTESESFLEDSGIFKLDITILEDITVIRGKIVGLLNKKEMLRVNLKNACDHVFFRPLFQLMYNQTNRCGVFKGHHKFRLNIPDLTRKFYGGKSMYGNWTFITLFYNDNCNVHCDLFKLVINPKTSATRRGN